MASFVGGRIGLEGQVPNYALFERDVPWVYAETIFQLDEEQRTMSHTIRLSVDKVWKNDQPETGERFFNEIRIFRRVNSVPGAPFRLVQAYLFSENPGQMREFILSVPPGMWPSPEPEPIVTNTP